MRTLFKDLKIGDKFVIEDRTYMKIKDSILIDETLLLLLFNAVDIGNGNVLSIKQDKELIKISNSI